MASWGLVATVKAPENKVLAFVAHHLSLGASRIWLYFDDPDDPAHAAVSGLRRVTATRCTDAYWASVGGRHERHQNRQARNARHAYERGSIDWLGHIDVDEFIHTSRPVADCLDAVAAKTIAIKLEPFEAMHDPALSDDIYTARQFRGALSPRHAALRAQVLGRYQDTLRDGMLSHTAGKVIFRTGVPNLSPRLHSVLLGGERLVTRTAHPEMRLLHFHAQDRKAWTAALPFRLTRGAYQYHPPLQAFLAAATPDEVEAFYQRTQTLAPDLIDDLTQKGRLIVADLGLRDKIAALRGG
jgi:Glycosyl transferase family 2